MSAKYYNKMPFPVKFRKVWETDSPAIELPSGSIIEGPSEYLSSYTFLAPIPFDFHRVESMTQNANFEFRDEMIQQDVPQTTEPIVEITPAQVAAEVKKVEKTVGKKLKKAKDTVVSPTETVIETSQQVQSSTPTTLPFDPKTVNWLSVKIADLEVAAQVLHVDITETNAMKPKERKWELVKLIKKALSPE